MEEMPEVPQAAAKQMLGQLVVEEVLVVVLLVVVRLHVMIGCVPRSEAS